MKCFLILFIIVFTLSNDITAQKNIFGKITNNEYTPLNNINVLLYQTQDTIPAMVNYCLSSAEGGYHIEIPSRYQSFKLTVGASGYKSQEYYFTKINDTATLQKNFKLQQSIHYLDTVKINSTFKVRKSGDTITFNLRAYALKNENNIEQLISRLPGINIDEQGRISFNGTPITSILIEGDDMFQKNYQQLTRNAAPEIIDKIEIIKNYQKDKMLKDYNITNGQVLNLKLKEKYKKYFFGYLNGGIGLEKNELADVFLMKLTGKAKFQSQAGYNNTGNTSKGSNDNFDLDITSDKTNFFKYEPIGYKIEVNRYYAFNIPLSYQQINKTWQSNTNVLFKGKKNLEALFSFSLARDSLFQHQKINTNYLNNVSIERNNIRRERTIIQKYNFDGSKIDASHSFYFNLNFQHLTNNSFLTTSQNQLSANTQSLFGNNYWFNSNLNYNIKLNKNTLWMNTYSFAYQKTNQDYLIQPEFLFWIFPTELNLYMLHSSALNSVLQNRFRSSILLTKNKNQQRIDFEYTTEFSKLNTILYINKNSTDSLYRDFLNLYRIHTNNFNILYTFNHTFNAKNSVNFSFQNTIKSINFDNDKLIIKSNFFLPYNKLSYKYKFTSASVETSVGYQKDVPNNSEYYENNLLNNYRSLLSSYPFPYAREKTYWQMSHSIFNLKSQWISFASAQINLNKDQYIRDISVNGFYTRSAYMYYPNRSKSIIIIYNTQKLINNLSLNILSTFVYNYRDMFYSNNNQLYQSHLNSLAGKLGLRSSFKSFFNFDIGSSMLYSKNQIYIPYKTGNSTIENR